jgi:hypothetical protein
MHKSTEHKKPLSLARRGPQAQARSESPWAHVDSDVPGESDSESRSRHRDGLGHGVSEPRAESNSESESAPGLATVTLCKTPNLSPNATVTAGGGRGHPGALNKLNLRQPEAPSLLSKDTGSQPAASGSQPPGASRFRARSGWRALSTCRMRLQPLPVPVSPSSKAARGGLSGPQHWQAPA